MKTKILELIDKMEKYNFGGDGYKYIDSIELCSEIEKMEEWIPVTEILPTIPEEHYLVCVKNKNKECGIYIIDFAYFSEGKWHKNNTWEDITHWQPLPLPPNPSSHV